jgi:hypothetical protein
MYVLWSIGKSLGGKWERAEFCDEKKSLGE